MIEMATIAEIEERASIAGLLAHLSKERSTTYTDCGSPQPPDLVAEESPGARRIAIEHTRVVPQDLPSIDAWARLYRELDSRAVGIIGTFLVGPTVYGTRFPRSGRPITAVAEDILQAMQGRASWAPGVSIRVPSTPARPEPQVTVMMHDMSGSRIVGLPVFGRRLRPEVIEAMRGKVRKKVEDLGDHPCVVERILLVDVTRVSAIGVASLEEQLYDELEFLRMGGLIPVNNVYISRFKDAEDFARGTDVARVWPR